ncbi:hypothetical protein GGI42DRAFT_165563 [Trichoderma sp. SZMC 28013]
MYRNNDGKLCGPDRQPLTGTTRDELLWFLRTEYEGQHRANIPYSATTYAYRPSVRDVAAAHGFPDIPIYHWIDACNKSVPVYVIPGRRWLLLRVVLHNYIYRRWFRPYRSEIDHGRFICKFIYPHHLPDEPTTSMLTIRAIISLNQAICNKFEAQRSSYAEERCSDTRWVESDYIEGSLDHHILHPLFQALLIVVSGEKYNKETSETVGNLPVYLVRTGVEEGLSAPISFESISFKIISHLKPGSVVQVTAETAIDFVKGLEAREAAAFGLRPDPVADWEPQAHMIEDWKLTGETEPLVGPNSRWVNTEKHPDWTGSGERNDSGLMTRFEEQAFRLEAMREAGM